MFECANCPESLKPQLQAHWRDWCEQAGKARVSQAEDLLRDQALQRGLARSLTGSEFFFRQCCRQPQLLLRLLQSADLGLALPDFDSDASLDCALRRLRNRVTTEVIFRDFATQWDISRACLRLSALAELCIDAALQWHHRQLVQRYGEPRDSRGQVQSMVVLGMGKLGARELNLSSDIDLIFAYPEPGHTDGERCVENQTFFQRLGQRLIKSLNTITADGFVFRVDMRLRPYGDSGPLVSHFSALEDYYQTQGREWERYAMVKARPVAGDKRFATELMALLRPFTYRRYIDFSAIEALREMKALIQRQVRARGLSDNIKLGRGGIREVEFIAQAFQLIRGGRNPALRERNLLKLLPLLETEGHVEAGVAGELADCYRLLRRVEHALQAQRDQQTQALPQDDRERARLAYALGRDNPAQLFGELAAVRNVVEREFDTVIAPPADIAEPRVAEEWQTLWGSVSEDGSEEINLQALNNAGFTPAREALDLLRDLNVAPMVVALPASSRARLDQFMPLLLAVAGLQQQPLLVLNRVLPLVRSVLRRSAYLVLVNENPPVLSQLVRLCSASPRIAEQLARHPILLDELLDSRRLLAPAAAADLSDELRRELLRTGSTDLEWQMEVLRYFKQSQSLRIAAQEVSGTLPLMKVSDALTWLAEAILQHALHLAWMQMVEKYGLPAGASEGDMRFAIIAYGKLGGLELSYGSDLDIVFVHDADPQGVTDGSTGIDNLRFYTRLAQRLIHILQTRTLSGPLYAVDTRLRPSGNSGLLVTTMTAFEKYQRESAWTWEHQALVRARPVAGSTRLSNDFQRLRLKLLCEARNEQKLRKDVIAMRDKMRAHLDQGNDKGFDLKHGVGGIVDIEFLVQYAALAWAPTAPSIVRYTDTIRILESLVDAGLMPAKQAGYLIDAYKAYRSEGHRLALQQLPGIVRDDRFTAERKTVQASWQQLLG
ncbi:bifunctional [glutamate--ammonia ligase]-adenylyl-L-tyrosine phosphorylase/[glutamate--ammonia-ligase] adenylyltransferase [Microbulbifer sp. 2205BS26-8]|uniref:bifunctional [glutamate--ammonia ligase]-adenylyl-L-tyrosine phosphorylase/[glutamate--ammonia-ligase] adenylyltransferase n=1 Tax=Microbulbifer sp. 2205BS26-8 TaxID=3064386 RepID=UPI00273DA89F|nr:bifunctional [glutamate--ammonia ligase]-adenylyl-L-tyrosine phosphorylase/[glutamate--ammonia-ligase] adenylyltransferase [Microbulbifer sp. 2205BS26-8]MDP5208482.1 bifunctional [glutamate--ammonia ligase]-adenylyl-L-tyrosine phosphorylase/[glutamate--ammonia-ligase] adenylyltransferase [Microbulbifer sp. 2205BS26-8]